MDRRCRAVAALGIVSMLTTTTSVAAASTDVSPITAAALAPTHEVRGVVKSVTASTLVITPTRRRKTSEMSFVLTSSTHREGQMTVGSPVSVRYRVENETLLATAGSAHPEKQPIVYIGPR